MLFIIGKYKGLLLLRKACIVFFFCININLIVINMNKYKIKIIYNDTGPNINDILIKTLKIGISKNLKKLILKNDNMLPLNSTYLSRGK